MTTDDVQYLDWQWVEEHPESALDLMLKLHSDNAALRCQAIGQEETITRLQCTIKAAMHVEGQLQAENAELREEKARLDDVLASFYPLVAPLVEHNEVTLWEHMKDGRCRGSWAEDGSPYYFTVPHQLVPPFFALQRLAKLCRDKDAARAKEGQP